MLLPSALPCDARPPLRRSQRYLPTTPPPSDDEVAVQFGHGIYSTGRALQSLLGIERPSPPTHIKHGAGAATGPLLSPIAMTRMKISKKPPKTAPVPRGVNKRRRDAFDEAGRGAVDLEEGDAHAKYTTPKRRRIAPLELPLGVKSADFERFESTTPIQNTAPEETKAETHDEGDWTAEDDRLLVELVLEKLNLTKKEWDECAVRLGKDGSEDGASLGKRWKDLVGSGKVGLRRGRRVVRGRIDVDGRWR